MTAARKRHKPGPVTVTDWRVDGPAQACLKCDAIREYREPSEGRPFPWRNVTGRKFKWHYEAQPWCPGAPKESVGG